MLESFFLRQVIILTRVSGGTHIISVLFSVALFTTNDDAKKSAGKVNVRDVTNFQLIVFQSGRLTVEKP